MYLLVCGQNYDNFHSLSTSSLPCLWDCFLVPQACCRALLHSGTKRSTGWRHSHSASKLRLEITCVEQRGYQVSASSLQSVCVVCAVMMVCERTFTSLFTLCQFTYTGWKNDQPRDLWTIVSKHTNNAEFRSRHMRKSLHQISCMTQTKYSRFENAFPVKSKSGTNIQTNHFTTS